MLLMKATDLAELYTLLLMYRQTYGEEVSESLIEAIKREYEKAVDILKKEREDAGIPVITNPRGAGRKSTVTEESIAMAASLKESGESIRSIAGKMGCSTGHVHKLIHEHRIGEVIKGEGSC